LQGNIIDPETSKAGEQKLAGLLVLANAHGPATSLVPSRMGR
jgi:hypothetical protein